jgi:hypothetical protein
LPRPLQRRISETELTLHIIRASTPPNVKFNIFSRINQGGLPLTAQEIRNAIYPGEWRRRVRRLAESEIFLTATENKIKTERMEDVELALRFVAHYTFSGDRPDEENLDEFLNDTVEKRTINWSEQAWKDIEDAFSRSLGAAREIFGRSAFRKYYGPGEARRPINRGLFETESVLLARYNSDQLSLLALKSDEILGKLARLFESDLDFNRALLYATGRGWSSNRRTQLIGTILAEALK